MIPNQMTNRQRCLWTSVILLKRLPLPVWFQRPPREIQVQMNQLHRFHLCHHPNLQEAMHHISIPSIANLWRLCSPFLVIIWLLFLHEAFICPLYYIEPLLKHRLKCSTAFLILQFIPIMYCKYNSDFFLSFIFIKNSW